MLKFTVGHYGKNILTVKISQSMVYMYVYINSVLLKGE